MKTKEEINAYMREWRLAHPESIKAYREKWRLAHPEETKTQSRESTKAWRLAHPEEAKAKRRASMKAWRMANPEEDKARTARWKLANPGSYLRRRYGLTIADYEMMIEKQEGRCAICDQLTENLHVDYCHSTGVIRGLLCRACNLSLGQMGDSPERLRRAADYLEMVEVYNVEEREETLKSMGEINGQNDV